MPDDTNKVLCSISNTKTSFYISLPCDFCYDKCFKSISW